MSKRQRGTTPRATSHQAKALNESLGKAGAPPRRPRTAASAGGAARGKARACVTVIGGAGAMGRITVRDLAETAPADIEIVLADRNADAARAAVETLPAAARRRVRIVTADANDVARAARALAGTTVLINACHHTFNLRVMDIALACGSHYCDLGGLFHVTRQQLRRHRQFERAGLLAICGIGSAPGIVNVMARAAADGLDEVSEIHIAVGTVDLRAQRAAAAATAAARDESQGRNQSRRRAAAPLAASAQAEDRLRVTTSARALSADEPASAFEGPALATSYSLDTILDEASCPAALFTNGELTFVEPLSGASAVDFPKPVGRQYPARTLHSELATLPSSFADRGVREVSFRIAFHGDLMDRLRFLHRLGMTGHKPVRVGGTKVVPRDLLLALARLPAQDAAPSPVQSAVLAAGAARGRARKRRGDLQPAEQVAMRSSGASAASGPPDEYEVLRVNVRGRQSNRDVHIVSDCHVPGIPAWGLGVDVDTGCPPSIVAQMLIRGEIDARGVLPPERAIQPEPFFRELNTRGLRIKTRRIETR